MALAILLKKRIKQKISERGSSQFVADILSPLIPHVVLAVLWLIPSFASIKTLQ
jgi:hypothetical protein